MKFTAERKKIILDAIKEGSPKRYAAMLAGIAEKTLYDWLEKGRQQQPPEGLDKLTVKQLKERAKAGGVKGYTRMKRDDLTAAIIETETAYRSFLYQVEYAEAEGLMKHIRNVRDAGLEDWRASAWYLERRDPENWAKQDRLQVENQHSGSIETKEQLDLSKLTDKELSFFEHLLEKYAVGAGDSE